MFISVKLIFIPFHIVKIKINYIAFHIGLEGIALQSPGAMPTYWPAAKATAVACGYLNEVCEHPASLHIWGSVSHLVQHPKKDATTRALSSPAPWVQPKKRVNGSCRTGFDGHFTSLDRLMEWVQLFQFSIVFVITCTSLYAFMPPSICARKHQSTSGESGTTSP